MKELGGRRKLFPILKPELQLKLPGYCVLLTVLLLTALSVQAYSSYGRLYQYAGLVSPENIREAIRGETWMLLARAGVGLVAYTLVIFVASILFTEKMIGPQVAFRRHIQALKRGEYRGRVSLRRGDAFADVAHELNELTEMLQKQKEGEEPPPL